MKILMQKYVTILFVICLTIVMQSLSAHARNWKTGYSATEARSYRIIAMDGTSHNLSITYSSELLWNEYQTGRARTFKDDRNCHLDLEHYIRKDQIRSTEILDDGTFRDTELRKDFSRQIHSPGRDNRDDDINDNKFANDSIGEFLELIKFAADQDWSLEFARGSAVFMSIETVITTVKIFGNGLGRLLGLKSGINCVDAASFVKSSVAVAKAKFSVEKIPFIEGDYYLATISIFNDWQYRASDGSWVSALFVYPEKLANKYSRLLNIQAFLSAKRIGNRKLPIPLGLAVGQLPRSESMHVSVVETVIDFAVDNLKKEIDSAAIKFEVLFDRINQLRGTKNTVLNHSFQIPHQKLPKDDYCHPLEGRNINWKGCAISVSKTVPLCFQVGNDQPTFLASLSDPKKEKDIYSYYNDYAVRSIELSDRLIKLQNLVSVLNGQELASNKAKLSTLSNTLLRFEKNFAFFGEYFKAKRMCEDPMFWQRSSGILFDPHTPRVPNDDLLKAALLKSFKDNEFQIQIKEFKFPLIKLNDNAKLPNVLVPQNFDISPYTEFNNAFGNYLSGENNGQLQLR